MMPSPLTLGHILLAAALLEALTGAILLVAAANKRAAGPGTPDYARGRDTRRVALMLFVSAAAFVLMALATPLGGLEIG
ncbi:MAG TPA: hypothetical protein VF552_12840 [Allosphingosinicella sp.]|jgi:hypothetical protein